MSYKLFWGDLHSHCAISYGHGTAEQALLRAAQQLDFASITGHAFWPDMPTDRKVYARIIDYHNEGFARLAKNWQHLLRLQAAATEGGRFIAFPSYEWHSLQFGDHNVYAAGPQLPLTDAPNVMALRKIVGEYDGLAIPHHIGYAAGYRGIDWKHYKEERSPFVEIFSLHGCSESDAAPYPMLHDMGPRDYGSTAAAGWKMGHRFGIVGGTDHHAAYPGSHGDGRMGVFAEKLSRESLWEAFKARRVYAATGDRIDAKLFVDDAWIGSVIRAPGKRRIKIDVTGSDALDHVELLKNERIVGRFHPVWDDAGDEGRFRLRITWGWGRKTVPIDWKARLTLSDGVISGVETCFKGESVVAPKSDGNEKSGADDDDLPHAIADQSDRSIGWRSKTAGNVTMRHEATQAIVLSIEAPLDAKVTVEVNDQKYEHTLGKLLRRARSHFLRGWLSEAIRIGPLVPVSECRVQVEMEDEPNRDVDYYRIRAAQRNGQWAWATPIWVEC